MELSASQPHASRALLAAIPMDKLVVEDFFKYTPSTALAAISLAVFAVATIVVIFQTERYRWRFMHTVSLTGLLEALGYVFILICLKRSGKGSIFGPFVAKQLLLLLSPNLLQGTVYWAVGHVLSASPGISRGRCLLGKKTVTAVFAGADMFALFVQGGGMGIYATAVTSGNGGGSQFKLGAVIVVVGLAGQLIFFMLFTWLAIWVQRHPKNGMAGTSALHKLFIGLYANIAFLFVRNIYRFVEFLQVPILGMPAPEGAYVLADKEVLFYTLDTVPILLCFAAFILYPPGRYLAPPTPATEDLPQFISSKGGVGAQKGATMVVPRVGASGKGATVFPTQELDG